MVRRQRRLAHSEDVQLTDRLDVAWTIAPTAVGNVLVAASEIGLLYVGLDPSIFDDERYELKRRKGLNLHRDGALVLPHAERLRALTEGEIHSYDLPFDTRCSTDFQRRVQQYLLTIAYGQTVSYRMVAEALGGPQFARAVGNACARNAIPIAIPCHRVLPADGSLGRYGGGTAMKQALLDRERAVCERSALLHS